jgi:hypothetical protein
MAGRSLRRIGLLVAAFAAALGVPSLPAPADEPAAAAAPGGATPDETVTTSPASRRWARAVFFDLRGRGPTPAELDAAAALSPEALVDRMLADPAVWEAWLDRENYYYLLIDRFRPVSDRVKALPAALATGEVTARDATREIVVSAEFNARNPGNDTFVTVVLEQLLGIVVQDKPKVLDAGKKMYDGYAARLFNELGRSQADIVKIVLAQKQFSDRFVERQYRRLFAGPLPKGGLPADAARLHADAAQFRPILRDWLLSEAYAARTRIPRPKDDMVFIRTLFMDLLGREPTFDEFRNSRNAFLALSDPAPIRNVLARLLIESNAYPLPTKAEIPKPGDWVRGQFRRLLGREPTAKEVDAFVGILGEYGCEPRTIVLALATSPEYQYY